MRTSSWARPRRARIMCLATSIAAVVLELKSQAKSQMRSKNISTISVTSLLRVMDMRRTRAQRRTWPSTLRVVTNSLAVRRPRSSDRSQVDPAPVALRPVTLDRAQLTALKASTSHEAAHSRGTCMARRLGLIFRAAPRSIVARAVAVLWLRRTLLTSLLMVM